MVDSQCYFVEDSEIEKVKKQYEKKLQLEKSATAGLKVCDSLMLGELFLLITIIINFTGYKKWIC